MNRSPSPTAFARVAAAIAACITTVTLFTGVVSLADPGTGAPQVAQAAMPAQPVVR